MTSSGDQTGKRNLTLHQRERTENEGEHGINKRTKGTNELTNETKGEHND